MWTDKGLEELGLLKPFDKAMFLSGCKEHKLCNGTIEGYIVSEEKLRMFAELIIQYYVKLGEI